MSEKIRFFRYGLVMSDKGAGPWKYETKDLDALRKALGTDILVNFLRCFVWADRLQSLAHFWSTIPRRAHKSFSQMRDLQTVAWSAGGVLHEAADAVRGLEKAGLSAKIGRSQDWGRLRAMARRWRRNRLFVLVRNKVAFHVDPGVIKQGLLRACREGERHTIIGGDNPTAGRSSLKLGTDLLLHGLGMNQSQLERVVRVMAHDQLRFSGYVQGAFVEALAAAGATVPH